MCDMKNFNLLQFLSLILGGALTINGLLLFFTTNFNLGNVLTLGLGLGLLLYSIYFDWANKKLPKWLKATAVLCLALALVFASGLYIYGISDNADYTEDAVIVLGAAVQGDTPSLTLADRLDAAVEYHTKNPNALIVVSGGKGPQENVTEAFAMEKYLIEKGVPKEKILKEENATSTFENFTFSKEILDNTLKGEYRTAYITNEYHIYRAGCIAKVTGFENITHLHSGTRWYSVVTGTLRECLAVLKLWVLGT